MDERLEGPTIGELLGLLAHDLRNPLSALHSNLGYLRAVLGESDRDSREAVDDGIVSCDGLAHIIDNIDLLGQALQGGTRSDVATVDLYGIAREVVENAQAMARSHGVTLALGPPTQVMVTGVRDLLSRALANLVRNSIQHSATRGTVEVSVFPRGADGVAIVTDRGSALDPGNRLGAFSAEGQLASKSVPNGRYSRGLGLLSAKIAAEAARARVHAPESASGAANVFELLVPRA